MARDKKPLQLRPVDDAAEQPVPIRLLNRETAWKEHEGKPIRLGPQHEGPDVRRRLNLPNKDENELRTHQPGIEAIIEPNAPSPDLLEQNWGGTSSRRNPIPWGWFALIGLSITGAVAWSLTRVQKADAQAERIRTITTSTLLNEEKADREAAQVIDQINAALRNFFNATTVNDLVPLVRQPQRVTPLLRRYYANKPVFSSRLKTTQLFRPLTLNNTANFWMIAVTLANGKTHNLIVEIMESGEARIDWENLVCYQPIPWDDFATQRPTGTSLDFRVMVESDNFYSHEFANSEHWTCFRLTVPDSSETLFGYAPAGSDLAKALNQQIDASNKHQASLILRLVIPERIQSHRGVVIEKLLSQHWLYLTPPDDDS
jgi:hypothetical protein